MYCIVSAKKKKVVKTKVFKRKNIKSLQKMRVTTKQVQVSMRLLNPRIKKKSPALDDNVVDVKKLNSSLQI